MASLPGPDITRLLHALSKGEEGALDELLPLVLDDLRAIARRYLAKERASATFEPTELVHDFFLRLGQRRRLSFANRRHFFGSAADLMRMILVDRARKRERVRHGSGQRPVQLTRDPESDRQTADPAVILGVHQALERLEAQDPRAADVVEMRFFLGMTVAETAIALELSQATVKRDWSFAELWLREQLSPLRANQESEDDEDNGVDGSSPEDKDD